MTVIYENAPELEVVAWKDHCTWGEVHWRELKEAVDLDAPIVHTVGWVMKETDEAVYLVPTVQRDQDLVEGTFMVLKGTIVNRWKLNDKSTKRSRRGTNSTENLPSGGTGT